MPDNSWERVKEIVDAALRLDSEKRSAYLEQACGDSETIRSEVDSLLSSFGKLEGFMEEPAGGDLRQKVHESRTLAAGQLIGRYTVVRKIGEGGMGAVYLARDDKLGRNVAIKLLNEKNQGNEENIRRFAREARAASALNHPNILTIHEIDEYEGSPFIVSEYVDGRTLRDVLKDGPPPLAAALDIVAQVAAALGAAHSAGIIHRDIKPENLVVRDDGYVKVVDFGLAKLMPGEVSSLNGSTNETATGIIMGTANYMSPEQAQAKPVDPRTDIFSLGVVLYEMAVGRTPFEGSSVVETLSNIITKEPPPFPGSADSERPSGLEQIIRKTLKKDPNERYPAISDFVADLKTIDVSRLADADTAVMGTPTEETAAAPPSGLPLVTSENLGAGDRVTFARRAIWIFGIVIVSTLLVSATYFAALRYWPPTSPINSIAVMPFVNESGDAGDDYLGDGITESLINHLSDIPSLDVKPRSTVFGYKGRQIDVQDVARELNVGGVLTGRFVQRVDEVSFFVELIDVNVNKVVWSEQYRRSPSEISDIEREMVDDVIGQLRVEVSGDVNEKISKRITDDPIAFDHYLRGRFEWNKFSLDGLNKSVEYFQKAIDADPTFALAYSGLADAYINLGVDYLPPIEVMPKARVAALQAIALDDSVAEAHTSLASYRMFYEWDLKEAEKGYLKAISLDPRYATARHFYSHCLAFTGRSDEAIREMKTAVELEPMSLVNNAELGWTYHLVGRPDLAIDQTKKTIELNPKFEYSYLVLGLAQSAHDDHANAIDTLEAGLRVAPDWLELQLVLAYAEARAGRRERSENLLAEILRSANGRYINPVLVAGVYSGLGDSDKAIEWLEIGFNEKGSFMPWIAIEPQFSNMRSDPRFQDLVNRVRGG